MMEWCFKKITDPGEACPVMEWCFKKFTDPGEACPMMEWGHSMSNQQIFGHFSTDPHRFS